MSRRDQAGGALDTVREALGADEGVGTGATFMRGLTLGALIGAAVAGSALWQRRARKSRPSGPESATPDAGDEPGTPAP